MGLNSQYLFMKSPKLWHRNYMGKRRDPRALVMFARMMLKASFRKVWSPDLRPWLIYLVLSCYLSSQSCVDRSQLCCCFRTVWGSGSELWSGSCLQSGSGTGWGWSFIFICKKKTPILSIDMAVTVSKIGKVREWKAERNQMKSSGKSLWLANLCTRQRAG